MALQAGVTVQDLELAGRVLCSARAAEAEAVQAAQAACLRAAADGWTEVDIARLLGVSRLTVRKWKGK
jgi:DNA-binding NarL/FixJ family response regulator